MTGPRLSVLHVAPPIGPADGISRAVVATLRALHRRDDLHMALLCGEGGDPGGSVAEAVDQLITLPMPKVLGHAVPAQLAYPRGLVGSMSRALSMAHVAHFHGLWRYPTLLGGPMARRLRRPYVVSPHGLLATAPMARRSFAKRAALRLTELATLEHASAVLVTSELEERAVRELCPGADLRIVPWPVEVPPPAERSTYGGVRTILVVARFDPIKGLATLVRAFASVAPRFPAWRIRIVGPDSVRGYRRRIAQLVAGLGLDSRVTLDGPLTGDSLDRAYWDAHLFVLPSVSENFGLVVAEALAAGLPVVATRGSPWRELWEERCGWWVDAGTVGLTAALQEALSIGDAERQAMGARGRALIERKYSPDTIADLLAEAYTAAARR